MVSTRPGRSGETPPGPVPAPRPGGRTAAQRAGDAAEAAVATALAGAGWSIIGRHVRVGRLELDLVAIDPGPPAALAVVEVRWRRSRSHGLPEETVDARKAQRLRRAAVALVAAGVLPDGSALPRLPLRLDLVAVETGPDGRPRARHHRAVDLGGGRDPVW